MYIVYKHTNRINGKSYIGWTIVRSGSTPELAMLRRWRAHCKASTNGSQFLFHRAIRKYSINNWRHEILEVISTLKCALKAEQLWIGDCRTCVLFKRSYGYNMTKGGTGGTTYIYDLFRRAKISQNSQGEHNGNVKLLTHDIKQICKMYVSGMLQRDIALYYDVNQVTISGIISGRTWKHIIRDKCPRIFKSSVLEKCVKFQAHNVVKVCQIDVKTKQIVCTYSSAKLAALAVNARSSSNIVACCRGHRKQAHNFEWKYFNDQNQ